MRKILMVILLISMSFCFFGEESATIWYKSPNDAADKASKGHFKLFSSKIYPLKKYQSTYYFKDMPGTDDGTARIEIYMYDEYGNLDKYKLVLKYNDNRKKTLFSYDSTGGTFRSDIGEGVITFPKLIFSFPPSIEYKSESIGNELTGEIVMWRDPASFGGDDDYIYSRKDYSIYKDNAPPTIVRGENGPVIDIKSNNDNFNLIGPINGWYNGYLKLRYEITDSEDTENGYKCSGVASSSYFICPGDFDISQTCTLETKIIFPDCIDDVDRIRKGYNAFVLAEGIYTIYINAYDNLENTNLKTTQNTTEIDNLNTYEGYYITTKIDMTPPAAVPKLQAVSVKGEPNHGADTISGIKLTWDPTVDMLGDEQGGSGLQCYIAGYKSEVIADENTEDESYNELDPVAPADQELAATISLSSLTRGQYCNFAVYAKDNVDNKSVMTKINSIYIPDVVTIQNVQEGSALINAYGELEYTSVVTLSATIDDFKNNHFDDILLEADNLMFAGSLRDNLDDQGNPQFPWGVNAHDNLTCTITLTGKSYAHNTINLSVYTKHSGAFAGIKEYGNSLPVTLPNYEVLFDFMVFEIDTNGSESYIGWIDSSGVIHDSADPEKLFAQRRMRFYPRVLNPDGTPCAIQTDLNGNFIDPEDDILDFSFETVNNTELSSGDGGFLKTDNYLELELTLSKNLHLAAEVTEKDFDTEENKLISIKNIYGDSYDPAATIRFVDKDGLQVKEGFRVCFDQDPPEAAFSIVSRADHLLEYSMLIGTPVQQVSVAVNAGDITDSTGTAVSGIQSMQIYNFDISGFSNPTDVNIYDVISPDNSGLIQNIDNENFSEFIHEGETAPSKALPETDKYYDWTLSGGQVENSREYRMVVMAVADISGNIYYCWKVVCLDTSDIILPDILSFGHTETGGITHVSWADPTSGDPLSDYNFEVIITMPYGTETVKNTFIPSVDVLTSGLDPNSKVTLTVRSISGYGGGARYSAPIVYSFYTKPKSGILSTPAQGYGETHGHFLSFSLSGGSYSSAGIELLNSDGTSAAFVPFDNGTAFLTGLSAHGTYRYRLVTFNVQPSNPNESPNAVYGGILTITLTNNAPAEATNLNPSGLASAMPVFSWNGPLFDVDGDALMYRVSVETDGTVIFQTDVSGTFCEYSGPALNIGETITWSVEAYDMPSTGYTGPVYTSSQTLSEAVSAVISDEYPQVNNVSGIFTGGTLTFTWSSTAGLAPAASYNVRLLSMQYPAGDWDNVDLSETREYADLPDGQYALEVEAVDSNGITSAPRRSNFIYTDSTAPELTIMDYSRYVSTGLWFSAAASDSSSGISSYEYMAGTMTVPGIFTGGFVTVHAGSGAITFNSEFTEMSGGTDIANGTIIYCTVKAINGAGISSQEITIGPIIVDKTAPSVPIVTAQEYTQFTFMISSVSIYAEDAQSSITEYAAAVVTDNSTSSMNSADWTIYPAVNGGNILDIPDFTAGELLLVHGQNYYVAVKVRNAAGIWSQPGVSSRIKADFTPPEFSFNPSSLPLVVNDSPYDIPYTVFDDGNGTVNIVFTLFNTSTGVSYDPSSVSHASGSYAYIIDKSIPGMYTVFATITDAAGNEAASVYEQPFRLNSPPEITLIKGEAANAQPVMALDTTSKQPVPVSLFIYDPDDDETALVSWDLYGDGSDILTGPEQLVTYVHAQPTDVLSTYSLKVTVTDVNGLAVSSVFPVNVKNTEIGILYDNEFWAGEHTMSGDITVPENITLTINPGTHVTVTGNEYDGYDHRLTINGSLVCEPAAEFSITAGSGKTWNGIYITGNAVIEGLTISNAARGLTIAGPASANVVYSSFSNNGIGIHVISSSPEINYCEFRGNTRYGIKEDNGAAPIVSYCTFIGNINDYYDQELTVVPMDDFEALLGFTGNLGK